MSEAAAGGGQEPTSSRARTPRKRLAGAVARRQQMNPPISLDTPPTNLSSIAWLIWSTLNSDEMTARLCRIIWQITIGAASIMLPLTAIVIIVTVKAPADLKIILGCGSTILIWVGTWLLGKRWPTKRRPKQGSPRETQEVNDSDVNEGTDPR
jgi:hypothetical protein